MKARAIVLGEIDEFLVNFCKYLISKDLEVYLALNKNQELSNLIKLDEYITIIKFNDSLEEVKFLLNSIEPKTIYNLYGLQHKDDLKDLIEKNYSNSIVLLEAIRSSKSTMLINLIERTKRDEKGNAISIYTAILDSFNKVSRYYKDFYNIETLTIFRDEYKTLIKE